MKFSLLCLILPTVATIITALPPETLGQEFDEIDSMYACRYIEADQSHCWPEEDSDKCYKTCPTDVKCTSNSMCASGDCVAVDSGSYCMDMAPIRTVNYAIEGTNNDNTFLKCRLGSGNYTSVYNAHMTNSQYSCRVNINYGVLTCTYKETQAQTACDIIYKQCNSIGGKVDEPNRCRWIDNTGSCCYVYKDFYTGYWEKKHEGKCAWGCAGEAPIPLFQPCKTCSCNNNDFGTGQSGSKSFSQLC